MSRMVEVEAFVAVVAEASFTAAAARLGVSGPYVSKLVSRLEERLGTLLLRRSTRSLSLTEAGRRFHAECAEAMALVDGAERAASSEQVEPSGTLRVTLPTSIGVAWLSRAVANFMAAWPRVAVDAVYLDRFVDVVAEGFDVAVRAGRLADSGLVARRLGAARRRVVASPAYLAQHGWPGSVEALASHRCLVYSQGRVPSVWSLRRGDEVAGVTVAGPLVANSGTALADAARCGVGVAWLPDFHTVGYLASGELLDVLPGWGDEVPVQAVFAGGRAQPAKVRVFVDAVAAEVAGMPWAVGGGDR